MPSCLCKVMLFYTKSLQQNANCLCPYFCQSLTSYVLIAAKAAISFTQNLEDVSANEKDTMVTFECETNEPFVKVKWLKNDMEIFSGEKYRMHSDRKVHFLSVLMIEMRDDAEYTCVVVDDESIRTSARLYVEGNLPTQKLSIHYFLWPYLGG